MNFSRPFDAPDWPDALPPRYWLANARVAPSAVEGRHDGLISLRVADGVTDAIEATPQGNDAPVFDLRGAMVFPAFVDPHTHLDKGDLLAVGVAPERNLVDAIDAVRSDYANWSRNELEARIGFGLRTAFAHGSRALNTYCDWPAPERPLAWTVLREQRARWQGRIELRLTALANIDLLADERQAETLARCMANDRGVLGFYVHPGPHVAALLPRAFDLAARFDLDLDFHIDEHLAPRSSHLAAAADLARERGWGRRTVMGHACVLSVLPPADCDATLDALAASGAGLVALPYTNLHLQDSSQGEPLRTPRLRGIAPVHEARARGVPVAFGSDNHRDGFFPGGDLDPLQTLALAALAAQLDDAAIAWSHSIGRSAAQVIGLANDAVLRPGAPADLVLHPGRSSAEVLSRAATGRQVLRAGQRLTAAQARLPDPRELDGLRG